MNRLQKFLLLVIPWWASATQDLTMIVFVHGTCGATPNASLLNIYKVMLDDEVEKSAYARAVELMRSNPYMFQNQPMHDYGLQPLDHVNRTPGQAAALFAHIYDNMLRETFSEKNDTCYYAYGWPGVLSESMRYQDALRFYDELSVEYEKKSQAHPEKKIKICIVAYSHGGTVALQLARVYEKERRHKEPLIVDLLILLGTPIQKETDHLVINPLFKKVYHIYSRGDKIQKLDFFSFKRFFSKRRFTDDSRFITPSKVVQIELQLKPARRQYKDHEKKKYVNRSPGHIELWFFGWTQGMYRKNFPLYPLPTACLIPTIINAAQQGMPDENDLVIELYPDAERCVVKKRQYFKKVVTPGIKKSTLTKMQRIALEEQPASFSRKDYVNHMHTAIKQTYGTISEKQSKKLCACDS